MTADETNDALSERDEIEALLPWYVAGRLDEADHARVERYLAEHPDIAGHVALAREERDAAIAGNEEILPPGRASLDRLRASMASAQRRRAIGHGLRQWFDGFAGWLDRMDPPKLAMAAAAAALLIAVQGIALGSLIASRAPGVSYETATGPDGTTETTGTYALVAFAAGAPAATLTSFLADSDAQIIAGPLGGGVYRVRLSPEKLNEADAQARLEKLKARTDLVAFAALTR